MSVQPRHHSKLEEHEQKEEEKELKGLPSSQDWNSTTTWVRGWTTTTTKTKSRSWT